MSRQRVLALLAAATVVVTLTGCGLRQGARDPITGPATSNTDTGSLDDVLEDLDTVDGAVTQVEGDISEGESAEAEEE